MGVELEEYLTPEERAEKTMKKLGVDLAKTPEPKPSARERFKIGMGRYREAAQRAETVLGKGAKAARGVSKSVGKARKSVRRDLQEFRREQKALGGIGSVESDILGLPKRKKTKKHQQQFVIRKGKAYPIARSKSKAKKKKQRKRRDSILGFDMEGVL